MANKRDLKKIIRETCGSLAFDMVTAGDLFPQISAKDVEKIVYDCAVLQTSALSKINIVFDRGCKDFESKKEYSRARRSYFVKAYNSLLTEFNKEVLEIINRMNAALPDDVRQILKKAANA